jgi:hypothetical protein
LTAVVTLDLSAERGEASRAFQAFRIWRAFVFGELVVTITSFGGCVVGAVSVSVLQRDLFAFDGRLTAFISACYVHVEQSQGGENDE